MGAGLLALSLLGAGCVRLPWQEMPPAHPSEEIDFHAGAAFVLDERMVTLNEWEAGVATTLAWTKTEHRETEASRAAREAASRVPVGQASQVPDPVYEDVVLSGTLATDALSNAERILLPSYWPEGEYDVRGEENSVVWLSRAQYDELVSTRESHIALGLFDSTLQNLIGLGDTAKTALSALQGELAAQEEKTNEDVTKLTADADWSDYILVVNGEERTVQAVRATNMFANYIILANPENPLILQVSIKPWAFGIGMLNVLHAIDAFAGYRVTSITY